MPKFKHGHATKSGMTPTYRVWASMIARCDGLVAADRYANRGITVCERWRSFENFLADMGEQPAGMSLDRKDNDGSYEPNNCRWATPMEQANNRSSNRHIEHDGQRMTLSQWARHVGFSKTTLHSRLARGWSFREAIATGVSYANRRK